MKQMHPFLRGIAAGLVATFVVSVVALGSCAMPARDAQADEFSNLRRVALQTAAHVRPVIDGLISLIK